MTFSIGQQLVMTFQTGLYSKSKSTGVQSSHERAKNGRTIFGLSLLEMSASAGRPAASRASSCFICRMRCSMGSWKRSLWTKTGFVLAYALGAVGGLGFAEGGDRSA